MVFVRAKNDATVGGRQVRSGAIFGVSEPIARALIAKGVVTELPAVESDAIRRSRGMAGGQSFAAVVLVDDAPVSYR